MTRLTVADIRDCLDCREHFDSQGYALIGACASVGIEHGMTTEKTIATYLATFHDNGHATKRRSLDWPA